jgi:hypothetical protein
MIPFKRPPAITHDKAPLIEMCRKGPTPFLGDASLIAARFSPANRVTQGMQLERIVGRSPFGALLSMLASGASKRYNWRIRRRRMLLWHNS